MTDITKRLAEALREVSKRAKEWGTVGHMGIASIADSALAEYDRTAAQEANVQGGEWVMVPREPTNEMLDATREAFHRINDILTTHQVRSGHAVVLSDNEHPPMRNAYVAMLAAAPHPTPAPGSPSEIMGMADHDAGLPVGTHAGVFGSPPVEESPLYLANALVIESAYQPEGLRSLMHKAAAIIDKAYRAPAPASGEVTDAMVEAARGVLNKQRCMSGWITPLAARNALEAATRARQGEGKPMRDALISCARMFKFYTEIHEKKGDAEKAARNREMYELCDRALSAPNAADAEAYRKVAGDALSLTERARSAFAGVPIEDAYITRGQYPMSTPVEWVEVTVKILARYLIPTAAPVPADEGEKKLRTGLERDHQRRVVCAACKLEDGTFVLGARHMDGIMFATQARIGKEWMHAKDAQGFIDQFGVFMTRQEAWKVAEAAGQIPYRCGGDTIDGGYLFSENLY